MAYTFCTRLISFIQEYSMYKLLHRFFYPFCFFIIIFSSFLSVYYLFLSDLHVHTDIGRDFLLMDELGHKFALIGARSSINGLFHGPFWTYLNFPVFLISNGDPIAMGWFWAFLALIFLITSFQISKKMFSQKTAIVYIVLLSAFLIRNLNEFFHPFGALMLAPLFIFSIYSFLVKPNYKILLLHFFVAGMIVQFQMAIGIPFFILSLILVSAKIFKTKRYLYLSALLVFFFTFTPFILFEFRHSFEQSRAVLNFLLTSRGKMDIVSILSSRLSFMVTNGVYLFYGNTVLSLTGGLMFISLIVYNIRKNVFRRFYLLFLFYYFGFIVLSVMNGGVILHPHHFSFAPIIFLVCASLIEKITPKLKFITILLIVAVITYNLYLGLNYVLKSRDFTDKSENSWKFNNRVTDDIYKDAGENRFGYFVYSPDIYAYVPRYAMLYKNRLDSYLGIEFEKRSITYLIYAPIDPSLIWLIGNDVNWGTDGYWKLNKVRINKIPVKTVRYENGFRWEKYVLTDEEINVSPEKEANFGLHFR